MFAPLRPPIQPDDALGITKTSRYASAAAAKSANDVATSKGIEGTRCAHLMKLNGENEIQIKNKE